VSAGSFDSIGLKDRPVQSIPIIEDLFARASRKQMITGVVQVRVRELHETYALSERDSAARWREEGKYGKYT